MAKLLPEVQELIKSVVEEDAIHQIINNAIEKECQCKIVWYRYSKWCCESLVGTPEQVAREYGGILGYLTRLADPYAEGDNVY